MDMSPKLKDWILLNLKIGALSFGGSGRILLYQDQVVNKYKWLNDSEIRELATLGQAVPGPNLVNMAHLIGQRVFGFWGSVFGLMALMVPGSLMALLVFRILPMDHYWVRVLFQGFTLGSLYVFLLFVQNYAVGVFGSKIRLKSFGDYWSVLIVLGATVAVLMGVPFLKVLLGGALFGLVKEFRRDLF